MFHIYTVVLYIQTSIVLYKLKYSIVSEEGKTLLKH